MALRCQKAQELKVLGLKGQGQGLKAVTMGKQDRAVVQVPEEGTTAV